MKKLFAVLLTGTLIFILLLGVIELPDFGLPSNPSNNEVMRYYVENATKDTGAKNIVTGIILDYRAFDTFIEAGVLFTATIAIVMLLRQNLFMIELKPLYESQILKEISRIFIPFIYIFGIYIVIFGHLSPGGGFAGGTIIGASLILNYAINGYDHVKEKLTYKNLVGTMSIALILYGILKGYSFITGGSHLDFIQPPLGVPGNILSGGLLLPLNILVGIVVSITIYTFYILFDRGEI